MKEHLTEKKTDANQASHVNNANHTLEKMIAQYKGTPLDLESTSTYDKFSLQLFTNKEIINNYRIEITLQFDITEAVLNYEKNIKDKIPHTSLTAFLTWSLLKAVNHHKHFNYRYIMNKWFCFDNLPLFITVATGKPDRLGASLMENCNTLNFKDFCALYKIKIQEAMEEGKSIYCTPEMWAIYNYIANLPNLQFTALNIHTINNDFHRPIFCFGKRYQSQNRFLIPFTIHASHANVDPVLINELIETFMGIINKVPY